MLSLLFILDTQGSRSQWAYESGVRKRDLSCRCKSGSHRYLKRTSNNKTNMITKGEVQGETGSKDRALGDSIPQSRGRRERVSKDEVDGDQEGGISCKPQQG